MFTTSECNDVFHLPLSVRAVTINIFFIFTYSVNNISYHVGAFLVFIHLFVSVFILHIDGIT
jgi:hypothetical protein